MPADRCAAPRRGRRRPPLKEAELRSTAPAEAGAYSRSDESVIPLLAPSCYMIARQEADMRSTALGLVAIIVIVLLTTPPAAAHHPIAAKFDPNQTVTLNGTVVGIDWANPHVHLFLDIKDTNAITNWAIELESPLDLQKGGWSKDALKIGDIITVQGNSARDGSKQAWANSVTIANTNRRVFTAAAGQPVRGNQATKPATRWPDGQPRLGPLPGERGYWGNPSSTALVQSGANV